MKRRYWRVMALALAALALSVAGIYAAENALPQIKTRVSEVAVFKDGYGFFVRTGKSRLENGWAEFDVVPRAALGTVWVYSDRREEPVDLLVRGTRQVKRTAKAPNLFEVLKANVGSRVALILSDKTTLAGTLSFVSESADQSGPRGGAILPGTPEPYLLLKSDEGALVSLRFWQIQQIEFEKQPNLDITLPPDTEPALRAKLLTKRNEAGLGLAYLEQGIRWLPSYLVVLKDKKTAVLSLRATVVNDAEDLEGTRLSLVIGVPHFSAKGELDPIGLQQALATTPEFRQVGRAMMAQMAVPAAEMEMGGEDMGPILPPVGELAGEGMEQLYLYRKDDVTLRKGERAQIVLLTGEVPYENTYEWNADEGEEVWHCLKLTNTLKAPWTTGVAMTVKEGQPLGQDMLKYTPPAAETNLRVTQAPAIRVSRKEEEVSRGNPQNIGGYTWTLVTIRGELKIENYKDEAVQIEVLKTAGGAVKSASDKAEVSVLPSIDRGLNPRTSLKWQLSVGPGETKILTYQYQAYVRI